MKKLLQMKKYIIGFIVAIISIFAINNNVKAASSTLYLDEYYDNINFSIDIYEVIDYLKSIEDEYYVSFTYSQQIGYFNVGIVKKNSNIGQNGYNYYYHKNNSEQIYIVVNNGEYIYQDFTLNEFSTKFELFKENINNANFSLVTGSNALVGQFSSYINQLFLIYSNVDFVLKNDSDDVVYYNGVKLNANDVVPSYYDWLEDNQVITSFDEIINTNTYSQVEFEFNIPNYSECDDETNCIWSILNYEIKNVTFDGLDNYEAFGIPYLEKRYLYDTGNSNISKIDTIPLGDTTSYSYIGSYNFMFDITTEKLKLVVPLEYLDISYVRIKFDNSFEYTVNYIEREQIDYIGSVDITGKAGVMFIPNQIDKDMLLGFSFVQSGLYSLQLRDTYKSDYNVLNYYSIGYCDERDYADVDTTICNNGSNSYQAYINFKKGELEQSIFVINRNYYDDKDKDTKSIVYYDTRYFKYVIYDEITSTPSFNHPITDEEIILGDLTDYDSYYTNEVHVGFFTIFSNAFNEFKSDIAQIFSYINDFWNSLDITLKYFYSVVFSLVLFGFLIRFIL